MRIPSSDRDAAMLRIVKVVRRRLRQAFLAMSGKYRSMIYYSKLIPMHEAYMRQALALAEEAQAAGEVPVGAVVVRRGEVMGAGRNETIARGDPTAHAEMLAIREACRRVGNYRLESCVVYSTLEPCVMCAGALVAARVETLVFASRDLRFGGVRSKFRIADSDLLNHRVEIVEGVLAVDAVRLLQQFFDSRR